MLNEKSILKLCKRATKRNPKSVHIFDFGKTKARYLETNQGVFRAGYDSVFSWDLSKVPYVGF